jgi:hypothetical protein
MNTPWNEDKEYVECSTGNIPDYVNTTLRKHISCKHHRELGLQIALLTKAVVMLMDEVDSLKKVQNIKTDTD